MSHWRHAAGGGHYRDASGGLLGGRTSVNKEIIPWQLSETMMVPDLQDRISWKQQNNCDDVQ